MAFGGQLYIATGNQEPLTITEAIVTSERIFVEWMSDGQVGQLEVTSTNGVVYRGEFHRRPDGPPGACELTLFKSLHEHLLFGSWTYPSTAERGTWAFRLQTDTVRPNRAPAERAKSSSTIEPTQAVPQPAVQVEMTKPSGQSLSDRALKPRAPREEIVRATPSPAAVVPPVTPSKPVAPAKPVAPVAPVASAPAATMFSNQLDHLLGLTSDEFAAKNQAEIEAVLAAGPSSAVFKLSRSATAPELRALAAALIERQRTPTETPAPPPVSDPIVDSKTLRAQQRRSSKHWK